MSDSRTWLAFLRGINLGRRQVKMAELRAVLSGLGLDAVKTILASGNARFAADADLPPEALKARVEEGLRAAFGFEIGVVLREAAEIEAMLAASPFAGLDPTADVKRYVLLFDLPLPEGLVAEGVPGDFDVLRIDRREIYLLAHPLPGGRYGAGIDGLGRALARQMGKGWLETTRNWNTIEKALA